ncbi:MAG: hypothetical protein Q9170_004597 [Blastenia crenularia]
MNMLYVGFQFAGFTADFLSKALHEPAEALEHIYTQIKNTEIAESSVARNFNTKWTAHGPFRYHYLDVVYLELIDDLFSGYYFQEKPGVRKVRKMDALEDKWYCFEFHQDIIPDLHRENYLEKLLGRSGQKRLRESYGEENEMVEAIYKGSREPRTPRSFDADSVQQKPQGNTSKNDDPRPFGYSILCTTSTLIQEPSSTTPSDRTKPGHPSKGRTDRKPAMSHKMSSSKAHNHMVYVGVQYAGFSLEFLSQALALSAGTMALLWEDLSDTESTIYHQWNLELSCDNAAHRHFYYELIDDIIIGACLSESNQGRKDRKSNLFEFEHFFEFEFEKIMLLVDSSEKSLQEVLGRGSLWDEMVGFGDRRDFIYHGFSHPNPRDTFSDLPCIGHHREAYRFSHIILKSRPRPVPSYQLNERLTDDANRVELLQQAATYLESPEPFPETLPSMQEVLARFQNRLPVSPFEAVVPRDTTSLEDVEIAPSSLGSLDLTSLNQPSCHLSENQDNISAGGKHSRTKRKWPTPPELKNNEPENVQKKRLRALFGS